MDSSQNPTSSTEKIKAALLPEEQGKTVAYVHRFLDEYGLDPYEFRVFSHIIRRTGGISGRESFASLATMASICNISERKIQQVLQFLVTARMIAKEKNPGRKTDVYKVRPSAEWVPKNQLDELRRSKRQRKKNKPAQLSDDGISSARDDQ